MAVHQTTMCLNDPKLSYERVVHRIIKYLKATYDKGIIYDPNKAHVIEFYVDTDFAGGYD